MSDIFNEIQEDIRRDRMRKLWKRWGWLIITLATVIVLAFAGWRGWMAWQASRAADTGDRFLQAVQASDAGNHDEAIRSLEALARDGSGGYPTLARFRLATERALKGETDAAVQAFDALANDGAVTPAWRDIARLRAAALLVDEGKATEVAARVERLAVAGNPFRNVAREFLGLVNYRGGDKRVAARYFRDIVVDPDAPDGARNRAGLVLTLLAGDGVTPDR